MGTIVIVVNGILTWPGSARAWTDRAVTWFQLNTSARAEKFEYLALPLTRRLLQGTRARQLAELIDSYNGRQIILVGHSNGCDLITMALKLTQTPVHSVHLISAATPASFRRNGLQVALLAGKVQSARIYRGLKDWALALAHYTGLILAPFGLGYGDLGRQGPTEITDPTVFPRVTVDDYPAFGHSTFFKPGIFQNLLTLIARDIQ